MDEPLYFDDLRLGATWKSRAKTITESDVMAFANLTGDLDRLHVDFEYARNTPFGKPVAHGLLGLSFVAGLGSNSPYVQTVAFLAVREWQFLRPLFFGDTVHARTEIIEMEAKGPRRGLVRWKRRLVNQNDEVVQEGIFETLVATAPSAAPNKPHFQQKPTDAAVGPNS